MGRDNVDVVREVFRAFDERDYAASLEHFDPDVEWCPMEGTYTGLDGLAASIVEWLEPWEEHRIEVERVADHGGPVLAEIRLTARGGQSGMEVDQRFFQVYRLRDGRIIRMDEFVDRADALASIEPPEGDPQRGTR